MGSTSRSVFLLPALQLDCGLQHVADAKMPAAININLPICVIVPPYKQSLPIIHNCSYVE
jgi:hypothetical protein